MSNEVIKASVTPHIRLELDAEDGAPPKVWKLAYTYKAIAKIEEAIGKDIKKVDGWADISSGKDFPVIVWGGLDKFNPEVTLDEVRDILNPDAQRLLSDRIFDLMFPGLVDAYKTALDAKTDTGATADPKRADGDDDRIERPPESWVELWAWARYDFHLSWDEFEELTPGMFQELCKRRNVGIRYARYANALTAAAIYNVNRGSSDDPLIAAFDFVRDEKSAIRKEKVRTAKQHIKRVIGTMPMTTSREKFLEKRLLVIADLKASGHDNAEELFAECWPSLQPTPEDLNPITATE